MKLPLGCLVLAAALIAEPCSRAQVPSPPLADGTRISPAEHAAFRQALISGVWLWSDPAGLSAVTPFEFRFNEDGTAQLERSPVWKWEITGRRTVKVTTPAPHITEMTFDSTLTRFTALSTRHTSDGNLGVITATRQPLAAEVVSSARPVATPLPIRAVEFGFAPLLDPDYRGSWEMSGPGIAETKDGVTTFPKAGGTYWYTARSFKDFVLKLEIKITSENGNSGVNVRFPRPVNGKIHEAYQIDISAKREGLEATGAIMFKKEPSSYPMKWGEWNEMEITIVRQRYLVKLNGIVVNEFTGNQAKEGYIGLQNYLPNGVFFRNLRIKDLSSSAPFQKYQAEPTASPSMPLPAVPSSPAQVAEIRTDASQPRIEVLKDQAPNAAEWALAPLDQAVPGDVRQNLTILREDLLDEGKRAPKASANAYAQGAQLCITLLAVLEERTQTQARAGFRGVEANARTGVTSQALEARRNYKMSWPQFAREESQRAELKDQALNGAAVMAQRPKLDWVARTSVLRQTLEPLYAQFRAALRESAK